VTTKSRLGRLAKVEARRKGQCAGPKSPYITFEMRRLLADRLRAPGDPPLDVDDWPLDVDGCPPPIKETLARLMARFCPSTGSQILAEQPGVGLPSETQNPEPVLEPDKQRE
jgi:hypothetical protein